MARKKSIISQEGISVLFEVGKWDSKTDISGPCIPSDYELESTFRGVVDISLVECSFVVHHDFGIMTEEVWNALWVCGVAW